MTEAGARGGLGWAPAPRLPNRDRGDCSAW